MTRLRSLRKSAAFPELLKSVEAAARKQVNTKVKALLDETKPFDFEFSLPDLEGKTVSSADYRGKVLVVDFGGPGAPLPDEKSPTSSSFKPPSRRRGPSHRH